MTLLELTQVCKYCSMASSSKAEMHRKKGKLTFTSQYPKSITLMWRNPWGISEKHSFEKILASASDKCLQEKSRGCPEFEKFGDLTKQKPPLDKLESYHHIQMHFCKNSCINVINFNFKSLLSPA